jgi:release factor glutamine methyltransferase
MPSIPDPTAATIGETLRTAFATLSGDEAHAEAECLLAHVLERPRAWLYAHGDDVLLSAQAEAFECLLRRRVTGEPVAYLIGRRGFWRFDVMVTRDTLIPRPETERLVELALERLPEAPGLRIADLGTGSGAIALALAFERPQAEVIATDLSPAALRVASSNAQALGLRNLRFREGAWWDPLAGERFDLIASNPPYVDGDDPHLSQGDLRHEPMMALSPGRDGLAAIRILIDGAIAHLREGGWILLEHGWRQGEAVRASMTQAGLTSVHSACDLENRERITLGRAPSLLSGTRSGTL